MFVFEAKDKLIGNSACLIGSLIYSSSLHDTSRQMIEFSSIPNGPLKPYGQESIDGHPRELEVNTAVLGRKDFIDSIGKRCNQTNEAHASSLAPRPVFRRVYSTHTKIFPRMLIIYLVITEITFRIRVKNPFPVNLGEAFPVFALNVSYDCSVSNFLA